MAGKRQPTDVVAARGKKHLSEAEEAERRAREVQAVKPVKSLRAPAWLPEEFHGEFGQISKQLIQLMPTMIVRTDAETIAAWCVVHAQWVKVTEQVSCRLGNSDDVETVGEWIKLQKGLFTQARALAQDLGLTITSRCQLVVPAPPKEAERGNPFLQIIQGGVTANG